MAGFTANEKKESTRERVEHNKLEQNESDSESTTSTLTIEQTALQAQHEAKKEWTL
jgi:hypothetical protein